MDRDPPPQEVDIWLDLRSRCIIWRDTFMEAGKLMADKADECSNMMIDATAAKSRVKTLVRALIKEVKGYKE